MIEEITFELTVFLHGAIEDLPLCLKFIFFLWVFNSLNWMNNSFLNRYGIIPRTKQGLIGILLSPLLHSGVNHLLFNSVPLFALILLILGIYPLKAFLAISLFITIGSGILTWLFGRDGIHIGISAVITGYYGFILTMAYTNPTIITIFLVLIALYYFSSVLFSIFPKQDNSSFEGHFFGMVVGAICAILIQFNLFHI